MGQGGDTKIIQLVASKLKCPAGLIRIIENDSNLNWGYGGGVTSCGTPNVLRAVDNACNKFLTQYAQYFTGANSASGDIWSQNLWNAQTAGGAYTSLAGSNLSAAMTGNDGVGNATAWKAAIGSISQAYGWVQTGPTTGQYRYTSNVAYAGRTTAAANDLIFQGTNMQLASPDFTGASGTGANIYSSWQTMMACMSIVEVNMLTGNIRILETNIIGDVGDSINPSIDQGQMYGGYIFGLGAAFKEERTWDNNMNMLIKDTWDYKIPCIVDIPQVFNIDFYGNTGAYTNQNQRMIMDGKSVNELATQSVYASFFAAKSAIRKFRVQQLGDTPAIRVFPLQLPATPDRIQAAAGFTTSMLNVNPL
jgi:xanthine dehydrogenase/oxidase